MTTYLLPTEASFANMSEHDRCVCVELLLKQIDYELEGLSDGWMFTSDGRSRQHHIKLLRSRRNRLEARALLFDCWPVAQAA